MNDQISNEYLQIEISSRGGELQSIRKAGREYLWQGDPRTWPDRAINIFPYVARLTDGKYLYQGKEYQLDIHGFLPYAAMQVESRGGGFYYLLSGRQ